MPRRREDGGRFPSPKSRQLFADQTKHGRAGLRVQPEPKGRKPIQNWGDRGQQALLFGFHQDAGRASETHVEMAGVAAGEAVVDDQDRAWRFRCQRKGLAFARS